MAIDLLTIAAATGSDGGLGKIGTLPSTSGTFLAHVRCGDTIEKIEWILKSDNAGTYQLYRGLGIVDRVTLTLASIVDGETLIVNGLTFIAEDTEDDALASARKFYTGGADDTADAVALAALINNASYGVPGVVATSALGVVTLVPRAETGAYVIQAVTGTAAGRCAVATTSLATLVKQSAAAVVSAADTVGSGYTIEQTVNGWPYAYIAITNTDGDAATVSLKVARYRYRH
jgi:hypothetical protein